MTEHETDTDCWRVRDHRFLILRTRVPTLRERLEARCEAMFEQMPNTFPPKKMMRGIDEIQVTTGRILELVENPTKVADEPVVAK